RSVAPHLSIKNNAIESCIPNTAALKDSMDADERRSVMKTIALVALLFALAPPVHAITRTWTGNGSDNLWSTPANWSPTGAPQNGDDLVFPGQANRRSSVNDLAGRRFMSLLFNGVIGFGEPVDTLTIAGNPIVISNGVSAAHQNGLVRIQLNL